MIPNKAKFTDLFIKNLKYTDERFDIVDSLPPRPGTPGVLGIE